MREERIEKLAQKHAPFIFLHEDERYLPASLEYLLNKDETGKTKNDDLKVHLTLKFKNTENIGFQYNDLSEVLPHNGEKNSVLDTIGFNIFGLLGGDTKRDILEMRKRDPGNVTIYYSCIPNPEKQQQIIISYHFLYAYDSKQEEEGDIKFASHIFDRESINIVFNWDRNNPNEEPEPDYMIYGAHLEGQTMGSVKQDDDEWKDLQTWICGRVKVMWSDVYKIKENHPSVAVAKGSHAPYPAPGHYAVYLLGKPIVEPAGTHTALIPEGFSLDNDKVNEIKEVYSYKLKDLELGAITSKSILAYSGYIVDILGPKNAKFPPFTKRELNIDKWVNGDKKDEIYVWKPEKVEEEYKDKYEDMIDSINDSLA